ncbi:MAG: tetratricopeptide repeat protein [Rhizobiales bacterium]|nr:tetratricopeptide repeat protein [Hyphomicrobiales bacterium]NRB13467.1 tetratricopeptide repeat protein [Hyphomicrobiales bacterium]
MMKITRLRDVKKIISAFLAISLLALSGLTSVYASNTSNATQRGAPGTYSGNFLAANLALSKRDYSSAAAFLSKLFINDPTDRVFIESLFVVQLINGEFEKANAFASLYHHSNPTIDEADTGHYNLSRLFLTLGQVKQNNYKQALASLNRGDDFIISEMSFQLLSAWINYALGKPLDTADNINRLQDNSFFRIYYLINSAVFAQLQGRNDDADRFYNDALKLGGTKLHLIEAYGRFLERTDNKQKAFALYDDFVNRAGEHPVITQALERLKTDKIPAPFISNAQQAIAYNLYHIANIYYSAENFDESINYARLAQYMAPTNNYILNNLSLNFQAIGKNLIANVELEKIPPSSPFYLRSQIRIANNLEINGQTDLALKKLASLLPLKQVDETVYLAYAHMLKRNEKYEQSLVYYDKIINNLDDLNINHANLFFHRGVSYERLKQWPKSEKDFRQALLLDPNHSSALNYLGYTWVDKGIHLEQGLKMIENALLVEPRNAFIIDSLGWVYYKLGKYDLARIELEQALDLSPSNADISDHLGDVYWKLGRKLEAEFKWQQATIFKSPEINYDDLEYKRAFGLDALIEKNASQKKPQPEPKTVPNMGEAIVEEGESLWDISYRIYGTGEHYNLIFEANKSVLSDPEAIYPGQILLLPKYLELE